MSPPFEEMRLIPYGPAPSRMTPSRFHAPPPKRYNESHKVSGAPPASEIFLSLLSPRNPMNRLSGDQNGVPSSSTSASVLAVVESSERAQSCVLPSTVATNASVRPSGEIAGRSKRVAFSGGFTNKRVISASNAGRRKYATPNASKASASTAATIHAMRSRQPMRFDQAEASSAGAISVRFAPHEAGRDKASSAKPRSLAV